MAKDPQTVSNFLQPLAKLELDDAVDPAMGLRFILIARFVSRQGVTREIWELMVELFMEIEEELLAKGKLTREERVLQEKAT